MDSWTSALCMDPRLNDCTGITNTLCCVVPQLLLAPHQVKAPSPRSLDVKWLCMPNYQPLFKEHVITSSWKGT